MHAVFCRLVSTTQPVQMLYVYTRVEAEQVSVISPKQEMNSTCAQCDVEWIKKVGDEQ